MTHRVFCLAGDSELEFDLPGGSQKGHKRVHRMRLDEFVDKWTNGARREGAKPKREVDLSWIDDEREYQAGYVAAKLGMHSASNLNDMCRRALLEARKTPTGWLIRGKEVRRWRESRPAENRFDMRAKLAGMRIRQLNEDTGDIQWSHVSDAIYSGRKPVFEVRAGDFRVKGSKDHRVLTTDGWVTIGDIVDRLSLGAEALGVDLIVRKSGKRNSDKLDSLRLRKIGGVWRSIWQRKMGDKLRAEDPRCRRCHSEPGMEVHHLVPVHEDPSLALEETNVTWLCARCHHSAHSRQGWQGGTYLYGSAVRVEEVVAMGEEDTYDLEIAGPYPNFLANGVVVHNSRNAASTRAIPAAKFRQAVDEDPAIPVHWGKQQPGMQAGEEIFGQDMAKSQHAWFYARDSASIAHERMERAGLHKQVANRILEPWQWMVSIVTATEFGGWFWLRDHKDAQPEIRELAAQMKEVYRNSNPQELKECEWHLPLLPDREALSKTYPEKDLLKISTGRVARVSYLTHDGKRDPAKDIELHDRLLTTKGDPKHMSPFEHIAQALTQETWNEMVLNEYRDACTGARCFNPMKFGNLVGWDQYRKWIAHERGIDESGFSHDWRK
jgi:hypothetical protein